MFRQLKKCKIFWGTRFLMNFIWKNIKYPEMAEKSNIQGEVQISFDVNFDGNLINFSAISKIGYGLEEELIRVLKLTPKWIPAEVNKLNFNQQYLLSIPNYYIQSKTVVPIVDN